MLSISHLIIIFLVALIVFGPEKLPDLARNLSKLMREVNRATSGLRESFEQDLRQLEHEVLEQRQVPAAPLPAPDSGPDQQPGLAEPAASLGAAEAPAAAELTRSALLGGTEASAAGGETPRSTEPSSGKAVDGRPTAA